MKKLAKISTALILGATLSSGLISTGVVNANNEGTVQACCLLNFQRIKNIQASENLINSKFLVNLKFDAKVSCFSRVVITYYDRNGNLVRETNPRYNERYCWYDSYQDTQSFSSFVKRAKISIVDICGRTIAHEIVEFNDISIPKPVISGVDPIIITPAEVASFDKLAGVKVIDEIDGDITNRVNVTGFVKTTPNIYTLRYQVTNSNGITTTIDRTVTVQALRKAL